MMAEPPADIIRRADFDAFAELETTVTPSLCIAALRAFSATSTDQDGRHRGMTEAELHFRDATETTSPCW